MPHVSSVTTDQASVDLLKQIRRLLEDAFDDGFADEDWEHTLGGWHVVVTDDVPVAHAAVVPRTLEVAGTPFPAGYVEGVATAPARQGEGLGSIAMSRLTSLIRERFALGALSTDRHTFYERLGWERWRGPTFVRESDVLRRTEDEDDGIMVLRFGPSRPVDLASPIVCRARSGDDW